jgi:hypothetical protein
MKHYILLAAIFLSVSLVSVQAQHEVSIYGADGLSALQYTTTQGKVDPGTGGFSGIGYSYIFSPKWGINTGLEAALYSASWKANELTGSSREVYDYGGRREDMFFNATYRNYREKQRAMYLQIPLMLQFCFSEGNTFYAAAGVKAGIALSGSSKITADELITSAYFPETQQTFTGMPEYGYTTKTPFAYSPKYDMGFNLSLSAEAGYRLKLGGKTALYAGLYVDYGVLNVLPSQKNGALVYRPTGDLTDFSYNSILKAANQDGENQVDKLNLFSVGVKFKFAFKMPE